MGRARIKEAISGLTPYEPGVSSHDVGRPITKLSSNENPYGPSPRAIAAICRSAGKVNLYPDKESRRLRAKLSKGLGLPTECISIGNGSDDIIENLVKLYLSEGDELVTHSAFSTYQTVARALGATRRLVSNPPETGIDGDALMEACDPKTRVMLVCTPDNPTGAILARDKIEELLSFCGERGVFLILDEAYNDFSDLYVSPAERIVHEDLDAAVTRTFSKAYGLAGLRIGYCLAPKRILSYLNLVRMPFNASSIAQEAAMAALDDPDHFHDWVGRIKRGRGYLKEKLSSLGLRTYPSEANFVLVSVEDGGHTAESFTEGLLGRGYAVRDCSSFGLPNHVRISVGTEEQNSSLISAVEDLLS